MLHAVAAVNMNRAVVVFDWEIDVELALRHTEDFSKAMVDPKPLGGKIELMLRYGKGVGLL
jgi:hypothetical protein